MKKLRRYLQVMAALAVAVALVPAIARADEKKVLLDYRPQEHAVADRTVHFNVKKLDRDTHEYVRGARLQIIDKETGSVVAEWTSDGSTEQTARELDVDHPYILHEVSAPEGYKVADDVEFVLRSVNFETKGEVISGATTADGKPNAFQISLFDEHEEGERTVVQHRETPKEDKDNRSAGRLSQTSDPTNYLPAIVIAVIGLIVVIVAIVLRRRNRR